MAPLCSTCKRRETPIIRLIDISASGQKRCNYGQMTKLCSMPQWCNPKLICLIGISTRFKQNLYKLLVICHDRQMQECCTCRRMPPIQIQSGGLPSIPKQPDQLIRTGLIKRTTHQGPIHSILSIQNTLNSRNISAMRL